MISNFSSLAIAGKAEGEATAKFREWVNQAEAIAMRAVESAAGVRTGVSETTEAALHAAR
jgi:hypothetical protein